MKYYILNLDFEFECIEDTNAFIPFDGLSLSFGEEVEVNETIKLLSEVDDLPNCIPVSNTFLVFNNELVSLIESFGVDYLQCFPVEVFNKEGRLLSDQYKIVNIKKVKDVIDVENSGLEMSSDYDDFDPEEEEDAIVGIESLKLDKSKTEDELIFRVKGCEVLIVVREDLAQDIVDKRLTGIEFYPADSYRF